MTRGRLIAGVVIGLVAVGLGWALMSALARVLRDREPVPAAESVPAPVVPDPAAPAAVPRIKATLFFASESGGALVPVEQDVPLAQGRVDQARALVEAQLSAAPPEPLVSAIPAGAVLRGVFVSETHEAFIDLDAVFRDAHPGGSMHELLSVFAIVNVVTTNLADIERVQLLIEGREVDTLAGHVDLRRPLRKNEALIAP
ncbi:MAG: GerMN domain-containing protein [Acidobacteriota bacterium]